MTVRRAVALVAALLSAVPPMLLPMTTAARAAGCHTGPGFFLDEQPHAVARALGNGFAVLTDTQSQRVEFRDARTGKLRWASRPVAEGPTFLANMTTQAVTVTVLPCAALLVRRWASDSGRALWARAVPTLPHVTAAGQTFHVADHDLGQGDWNGDGVPDLALYQAAREYQSPNDVGLCQPSGFCMTPTQQTVDSRLVVIDGKTGRVLLNTTVGGPSLSEGAATWAADGRSIVVAGDAGPGGGTVVKRLSAHGTVSATLPLPVGTDLQVFGTNPPVLVSTVSVNQDEVNIYTGLTQSLSIAWEREMSGGRSAFPLSQASLMVSGAANGVAVAFDTTTGVPKWAAPTPSMFGSTYDAGRWTNPTTNDVAIVEPNATGDSTLVSEVLSGATGLPAAMLDADEWPEGTCDSVGLATVVHPYNTSTIARLRRSPASIAWAVPFTVPAHNQPVVLCANRQAGVALAYAQGIHAQIAVQVSSGKVLWRGQLPVSIDP